MLAKLTSKNQLTLPKSVTEAIGPTEYFDVELREGQIVLTPVRVQRADAVRAKLAELDLGEQDVRDAIAWARSTAAAGRQAPPLAVAEPEASYRASPGPQAATRAKEAAKPKGGASSSPRKRVAKTSPRRKA
jgi:hypothetical protein